MDVQCPFCRQHFLIDPDHTGPAKCPWCGAVRHAPCTMRERSEPS